MKERLLFQYRSEEKLQKDFELLHNIYDRIVDDKSKEIYRFRLLMTFTGELSYIRELVLTTDAGKKFEHFLKKQNNLYLYGAGIRGKRMVHMFPEIKWKGFIDQNQKGTCNGLDILTPAEMKGIEDAVILITNLLGVHEIRKNLLALGIKDSQIYTLDEFDAHQEQYFEERCIKHFKNTKGCFLDAGSFDGADSIRFINSDLNQGAPIYAFEPDKVNYDICRERLEKYENARVYNIGLSDERQQACFLSKQGEMSRITNQGDCLIRIDTIDSILGENEIGFIKMDIEGYEKKAILGAKKHIENDKPNMMISVYHNLEDVIEIPKLLLNINPEYKFCLGHYSLCNGDTVLYAF